MKPIKDHTHGVVDQHCGHEACREATYRYQKHWRYERASGGRRTESTEAVRLHIRALKRAGWSIRGIGEASGVPANTISRVARKKQAVMRRTAAARILRLRPEDVPDRVAPRGFVPKHGTVRRLQNLIALGWPPAVIAAHVNERPQWVYNRLHQSGPYVTQDVRDRVAALYEDLSMKVPPQTSMAERRAVARARTAARKAGWRPPLDWDDDALDDPRGRPTRAAKDSLGCDEAVVLRFVEGRERPDRKFSHSEAAEIVHRMLARGVSGRELERYGLRPDRYKDEETA